MGQQLQLPNTTDAAEEKISAAVKEWAEASTDIILGPRPPWIDPQWYEKHRGNIAKFIVTAFQEGRLVQASKMNLPSALEPLLKALGGRHVS